MTEKQTQQEQPCLLLNDKPATKEETRRILSAKAPASDKNERATKPLLTASRPFSLLK